MHLAQNGLAFSIHSKSIVCIRTNNGAVFSRFVQAAKEIFDVQVRDITSGEVVNVIDYKKEIYTTHITPLDTSSYHSVQMIKK